MVGLSRCVGFGGGWVGDGGCLCRLVDVSWKRTWPWLIVNFLCGRFFGG